MNCNLCGSGNNKIISGYTRFEKNNILQCRDCGLVFLDLKKPKEEVGSVYTKEYREVDTLPKISAEEWFTNPVIIQDCKNRMEWISRLYGDVSGKKILDIGCSSGYFLKTLYSASANASGVELNESCSDYARSLGFTVYSKNIETLGFKNEFDLIVMFHTLEHVFDPMSALRAIHTALKRGGVFIGEVPNQHDWRIRIFDNEIVKRFHYDPFHYYYFSPDTLTEYLRKCKFMNITLETVEKYNSLTQLSRIMSGKYNLKDADDADRILKQDIFAKPEKDVRIHHLDNHQETEFNRMFEKGANSELMGNCLRWMATKG
jgi:2-polyprenyl-3-methyl-5-hydroxy-6-metoxy-1,4-benzoquinol methylase